jgi:AP-4 complex subunit epsilon-1
MTTVFELGGDLVKPEVANNLMRLIAEGSGEDDDEDQELRTEAVETFLQLIAKPNLSNILKQVCGCVSVMSRYAPFMALLPVQTMFWVLGEYGYMAQSKSLTEITTEVCETAEALGSDATSRGYAISAALKLTAQLGSLLPCVSALTQKYSDVRFFLVS